MRPSPSDAIAVNEIVHIGVGTPSPPDGKISFSATPDVETVPSSVPVLNLWHDAHEPSAALSGARSAVPDSAAPFCATIHDIFSAPCGSLPVPIHAPASVPDAGGDGVGAGVGAGVTGDAGADGAEGEPQPAAASAASTNRRGASVMVLRSPDRSILHKRSTCG